MDANELMARILYTDPTEEERQILEREMIQLIVDELDEQFIKAANNYIKENKDGL